MTTDILARIDAALKPWARRSDDAAIRPVVALREARAEIVRLLALIPEPPTDDAREAIARAIHDGPAAVIELEETGVPPHTWDDCPYQGGYLRDADAVIASDAWRDHAQPTDDEANREEYREGYETWHAEGQRQHAALLKIWHMAEPTDTAHLTYGDDPAVVVAAVRALLTPTDDERKALEAEVDRRYPPNPNTTGWSYEDAAKYEGIREGLLEGLTERTRGRGPITDEAVERGYNAALFNGVPASMVRRSDIRAILEAARDAEAGR